MMDISIASLIELVREAGKILLGDGRTHVSEKGYADFVTEADMAVQAFLIKELRERYPEADVMSEESDVIPNKNGPVFIIDPVDGTTNLIRRLNQSCVALGLVFEGKPVIGVVYNPFNNEMYWAERGCGAFLNGRRLSVSANADIRQSLAVIGTSPYRRDNADENMRMIKKMFDTCLDIRRFGSAALDICAVADGRYELFCESDLKPWDYCAGSIILTEAGGKLTDWKGDAPDYFRNLNIAATNGAVHDALTELVADIDIK
ncbi:MAG: inositol monophosphatase [Clostridia bacterium]|nr:inositol monophosphatase [Clostridia bacterium]MBQ1933855.1 inositol monophosphatase [Clostridia bacterium]MBQ5649283.1 inositol monophosphatase [Clostridia bacterium]MBQ5808868.1 inositol monophosphatase [Clostridia bacterium]MBR0326957.1 inositol monophosphatase [Clostridia bacterium]